MSKEEKVAPKRVINPFIVFYPKEVDVRDLNKQGDGPPNPSNAAETLRPNSRPADRKPKKLQEEDMNDAIYRYLHKRRMNWFYRIDESTPVKTFLTKLAEFVDYAIKYLEIKETPKIVLKPTTQGDSFASWSTKQIEIAVTDRHPMDVFRSVAHELVHQKQHEEDMLHSESGETGSEHENQANALAGIIMRNYAKNNPELFDLDYISEGSLSYILFGDKKKGTPSKTKTTKSVRATKSNDRMDRQMERDRLKHEYRMKEIEARRPKKADAEPEEDSMAKLKAHFHNPKRLPALRSFYDRQEKNANTDPHKWHKDFVKSQGKVTKSGKKPFANLIRGLKESISLLNKSTKSNISYEVLCEVFDRAANDWTQDKNISRVEYAFNSVNSFIAGGKSKKINKDLA